MHKLPEQLEHLLLRQFTDTVPENSVRTVVKDNVQGFLVIQLPA